MSCCNTPSQTNLAFASRAWSWDLALRRVSSGSPNWSWPALCLFMLQLPSCMLPVMACASHCMVSTHLSSGREDRGSDKQPGGPCTTRIRPFRRL